MSDAFQKMFQQMMEQGQEMARSINPALENFKGFDFAKMWPTMSKDMMEMWFGNTFNREGLDAKTRLLLTIAGLTVLGAQAEAQMKIAIRHAVEAGATQREIAETIYQMSMFGGLPAMTKALEIAQSVFDEAGKNETGDNA
ncbi:carboxymuconolactone decarboxylase family protein [Albidovulum sediminicola]|uniref:Carboxymuconolactone decarboxylase family protein n=1 Tax=Albidovulum sediminicola TaxID=2984331 RepID=A0ABT2YXV4_9RHOB|nr:carboxymuconolactone decarboxylase family protein [Defluviimonas sp. WL0075]MCV2863714.1 carboxymuconolactone decarboxylase family protein [Defluviimonas sp. WL0075]